MKFKRTNTMWNITQKKLNAIIILLLLILALMLTSCASSKPWYENEARKFERKEELRDYKWKGSTVAVTATIFLVKFFVVK